MPADKMMKVSCGSFSINDLGKRRVNHHIRGLLKQPNASSKAITLAAPPINDHRSRKDFIGLHYTKAHYMPCQLVKALYSVRRDTLSDCAMSLGLPPCSLSLCAWATCCADSNSFRPILTPRA